PAPWTSWCSSLPGSDWRQPQAAGMESGPPTSTATMHQLLAEGLALEQALECLCGIFESPRDGFPVLEIATGHLLCQQCRDLLVLVLPLGDQEETVLRRILQLAEDMEGGFHLARVLGIVGRDVATDRHPRAGVQQPGHGTADVTADVLEVHINAVRTGRRQIGLEVARLVIDTGIKAQLLDHEAALLLAPGDADNAATELLGGLAHHGA